MSQEGYGVERTTFPMGWSRAAEVRFIQCVLSGKKNTSGYERAPVRMVGALFLTFHIPLSACFLCPVRSTGLSCLPI